MRYRILTLLVAVLLAGGCGPSEPVQEGTDGAGSNAPADTDTATPRKSSSDLPLLEPEPKAEVNEPSEPADNQPPLIEPEPQAEPAPDERPDSTPSVDSPQTDASTTEPDQESPGAEVKEPQEETAQANDKQADAETADAKVKEPDPLILALEAIRDEDYAAAKGHVDGVLKEDPNNGNALFVLTAAQLREGEQADGFGETEKANGLFLEANATLEQLTKVHPELKLSPEVVARVRFHSARAYARSGKPEAAVAMVQSAVDAGLDNLDLLLREADLEDVRQRPDFKAIVEKLRQNLEARAADQAKELLATHKPFEFDFSLKNLEGKSVSLSDFAGKVLVVDIWGTWCGPCRDTVPHLVDLHKKYQQQGLEIVGISYEYPDPGSTAVDLVRDFVEEKGVTYACVIGEDEILNQIPEYGGEFPTMIFIDRGGKVRAKVSGALPPYALEAIVKQLLNEQSAKAPAAIRGTAAN